VSFRFYLARLLFAAAVSLALVQAGFASIVNYDDGHDHSISGGTYGDVKASNSSVLHIYGGTIDGKVCVTDGAKVVLSGGDVGGLEVGDGCANAFGNFGANGAPAPVPEPCSFLAWFGLGAMGFVYSCRRKRSA